MQQRLISSAVNVLVFVVAISISASSAQALIIDTFETPQSLMAASFMTSDSSSVVGADILGDERDAVVTWISGPVFAELDIVSGGGGLLSFSLGAKTMGSTSLTWDGNDSNASGDDFTGLGGVDLTDGGTANAFEVDVLFDDLAVDVVITVLTDATKASAATIPLPGGITSSTDFSALFASFTPTIGGGADFTDVGMIRVEVAAALAATDVLIDSIRTVDIPEPSTMLLASFALVGLVAMRRRR